MFVQITWFYEVMRDLFDRPACNFIFRSIADLITIECMRNEVANVGMHTVLLGQHPHKRRFRLNTSLCRSKKFAEKEQPALGIVSESLMFNTGQTAPEPAQLLIRVTDRVQSIEPSSEILITVWRKLILIADQKPPMTRLERENKVEAVSFPGLLDNTPVESLMRLREVQQVPRSTRAVDKISAATNKLLEIA